MTKVNGFFSVPVTVAMRMGMKFAGGVGVTMGVYEARAEKQRVVVHDL